MNPLEKDRADLVEILETTGFTVDESQPETIEPGSILIDSVEYEWGSTFASVRANYTAHVILDAYDAQSAARAHEAATFEIHATLTHTGAADLNKATALFNMQDAAGNIYPAFTLEITSHINYL